MTAVAESPVKPPVPDTRTVQLGNLLVSMGKLSARDMDRAVSAQTEAGGLLPAILVNLGLVSELDVAQAQAKLLGVPFVSADELPALAPELEGLQPDFLRTHHVYPMRLDDTGLTVAMAEPDDAFVIKALGLATGLVIHPCVALGSDISRAMTTAEEPHEDEGNQHQSAHTEQGQILP